MRKLLIYKLLLCLLLTAVAAPGMAFNLPWQKDSAPAQNPYGYIDTSGYGAWAKCVSPATLYLPLGNSLKRKKLDPNCQPDVLYSWGRESKLATFLACASGKGEGCNLAKRAKAASQIWQKNFPHAVFATVNPLSTFGYGELLFRIKLKPDTKFKFMHNPEYFSNPCNLLGGKAKDTVLVRSWSVRGLSGVDYILCGTGPIHSWSIGTKQGYAELEKAYQWTEGHSHWMPYVAQNDGKFILFDRNLDEGNDFSRTKLQKNFALMKKMMSGGETGVFYAPGVEKSGHFSTKMDSYWSVSE